MDTFFSFFISVYGVLVKGALVAHTNLSLLMAEKVEEPISRMQVWINGRIEIVVARLYSRMIRRDFLTVPLWDRDPDWESGLGLVLAQ